jgi:polyhydroxyalkanoate synthase subunit PhaC
MPAQPNDATLWLANVFQEGQEMMRPFIAGGAAPATSHPGPDPYAQLAAATKDIAEMQQNYLKQMSNLWFDMAGMAGDTIGAADRDKRFAGDAWQNDSRFDVLKRAYLAYSGLLQSSVEWAPVDDKTRRQLRFAVRQFVDAMSPANFLATNPEAMQLAMETGGASLTEGIGLFFKDLAKGRVSITDESAFQPGKNLAVTAGDVIFENDLIQLIQYAPRTPKVYERPLVIIPPCINKFYILDLTPENSFVRYMVEQGHTVFMVSWRNITPELGHLTWDDYLQLGVVQAIDVALDVSGAPVVNTLGFCVGGTLLASAMGVMKANAEEKVASMTLLTAMLDFAEPGELGTLITEDSVASREAAIGKGGVMEGKDLALTFSSLRANDLIWPYVVSSYLKGKSPPAFDLLYWNSDGTNLPGPMFCWYVRNMYLDNNLRVSGKTIQCGMPIDLSDINVPAFIYASRDDHIVPWRTAYLSNQLLLGENTFVLGASGHIAGVINPPTKNKRNHWVDGEASADPEHWLATARDVPGSWWGNYGDWLAKQAGHKIAAPKQTGNRKYRRIEPAPGRYVMAKAE